MINYVLIKKVFKKYFFFGILNVSMSNGDDWVEIKI